MTIPNAEVLEAAALECSSIYPCIFFNLQTLLFISSTAMNILELTFENTITNTRDCYLIPLPSEDSSK